jgi:hypothetical protein
MCDSVFIGLLRNKFIEKVPYIHRILSNTTLYLCDLFLYRFIPQVFFSITRVVGFWLFPCFVLF